MKEKPNMFCFLVSSLCVCCLLSSAAGMVRHYYIAAVDVNWDYAPSGRNLYSADSRQSHEKLDRRMDRIGHVYTKAIFRGFTDATFKTPIPVPEWAGLQGPPIKAEVGDEVHIHFRNFATGGNFSVHPHGFVYNKRGEGALYIDGTKGLDRVDDKVPPGGGVTYIWIADQIHAPTKDDDNCVLWGYHSHTESHRDVDSGLIGMAVICRNGILDPEGRRRDVDREFHMYVDVADEANSWYFDRNMLRCGNPLMCKKLKDFKDKDFENSNLMYHMNGRVYGNLADFPVCAGERVVWYFMTLNLGMHSLHANGQTMIVEKKRTDSVVLHPASFYSAYMTPMNPGRWELYCRNTYHNAEGLTGFLFVNQCFKPKKFKKKFPGFTRQYFIAIEETLWNYAPGLDSMKSAHAREFLAPGRNRIGPVYKKAVYREYTDESFTKMIPRGPANIHLGLSGPPIKAEVGERIVVVVLNRATRPYSLLANGVSMTKENAGTVQQSGKSGSPQSGAIVAPGQVRVYTFDVPVEVAPTPLSSDCITYVYHSAVDLPRDIHTGLFGPLLICKPGTLTPDGKQKVYGREFFLNWQVIDENLSWYIDENIKAFTAQPWAVNKDDEGFRRSNQIRAINGYTYGTLQGLEMCVGEMVAWHMFSLGGRFDHHHFSFESNNFLFDGRRLDTATVFPGTGATVVMVPDQAGSHLLRNGQLGYESEGMFTWYNVLVCPKGMFPKAMPPDVAGPGLVRRIYIGIIETDWDYCPVKVDPGNGQSLINPDKPAFKYIRKDPDFVGSIYLKAIYREFTDSSFKKIKPRSPQEEHLGIMGPFIRGNVGDTIEIVLRNFASFPYNLVPRNLPFADGSSITDAEPTPPGETRIYRYYIPARSGPLKAQPNCIGTLYTSRVAPLNDTSSGLFGPLVICRPGLLDSKGRRTDEVSKEFATSFVIIDENQSNYNKFNFMNRAPARRNISDELFMESNRYHSINGLIYGNLHGLVFSQGERSAWYVFALGSERDIHTVHFHGQLYLRAASVTLKRDVLEIFAGTYETVEMMGYNPGVWMFHCHVGRHTTEGMKTVFTVLPSPGPGR